MNDNLTGALRGLIAAGLLLLLTTAHAQTGDNGMPSANWNGTWIAQGTLFSVSVTVQDSVIQVDEVQSLGFVWTSRPGRVAGDQASIEVSYAGVTARLLARLTGDNTAVVEAASCMPEFMVVCALAKGQQATFIRQAEI